MNSKRWICIASLCLIPLTGIAITPQIAAGVSSTAVLKQDGTMWGVGNEGAMQPTRLFPAISDVTRISTAGANYALRANGELWAVGRNEHGQTGDGTTGYRVDPYKVLDNVVQFSANHMTAMAVQSDGTAWAWGANELGQLGDGTKISRLAPVKITGLANIVMVAAGIGHGAALASDGHVWVWGIRGSFADGDPNWYPNLYPNDDPRNFVLTPVQVPSLSNIVSIAAGGGGNLALDASGTLWSHGNKESGTLGNGHTDNPANLPVQVSVSGKVTAFSVGSGHDLALSEDGSVWAWGQNVSGQLGLPFSGTNPTPAKVALPGPAIDVAAGWNHSGVLLADGRVMTFGDDSENQLGRGVFQSDYAPGFMAAETGSGSFSALTPAPANLGDAPNVGISVADAVNGTLRGFVPLAATFTANGGAASGHAIVSYDWVSSDGSILAQGQSVSLNFTQPGAIVVYVVATDDTGLKAAARQRVVALPPDVALSITPQIVAAKEGYTFNALSSTGMVYSWGAPFQLGSTAVMNGGGLGGSSLLPVDPGLRDIAKIASAGGTSFALTQGGLILAWGFNANGALGTGSSTGWNFDPVLVNLPKAAIDIVSFHQAIALLSDGSVWAWGANEVGQLGLADTAGRNQPVQIPGLANIAAIVASRSNGYAVDRDGNVWAWGDNGQYQLGQGDATQRLGVVKVDGLPPIAKVAAGDSHVLAIARDGRVFGWSSWNVFLGDASLPNPVSSPAQVPALSGFTDFVSNANYTLGVKSDGSVWTWGSNSVGQMPGSTALNEPSPIPVAGVVRPLSMTASIVGGAIVGNDGYVLTWGMNTHGQIGDGTMARRRTPVAVVNQNADGFLNLLPGTDFELPPSVGVPFFVVASGGISDSSATVYTRSKFNGSDVGKSGNVFVTATVPPGSLVAAQSPLRAASAIRPVAFADTPPNPFVLIQLTSSGWQPVVNGQLIAYASGVLGDQLAAQTILNNTDTTNLKGAQFCLGYGASAEQMVATGTMRVVASIPDPNAASAVAPSCIVAGPPVSYGLALPQGWSLLGNSLNRSLSVTSLFNDANAITSVWKWDAATLGWQFYTPLMETTALQTYAASKNYAVLSTINPGEGYWVNAKAQPTLGTQSGDSFILTGMNLAKGWNLVATGNDITPSQFNANLKASAVPANLTTLWAWDNLSAKWYFYAPSLEAQGGTALSGYIASKDYLDFSSNNKMLGNGTGFWVNR